MFVERLKRADRVEHFLASIGCGAELQFMFHICTTEAEASMSAEALFDNIYQLVDCARVNN